VAELIYDLTVRFCSHYIRKFELKLTSVARGSLEELRRDYEDFLRQRGLPLLPPDHPALVRFKAKRGATLKAVQAWVAEEIEWKHTEAHGPAPTATDRTCRPPSVSAPDRPCSSLSSSALAANAALSPLNLACHLLDRQLAAQARHSETEGGFTERLHRVRSAARQFHFPSPQSTSSTQSTRPLPRKFK
jgi:four helix bundle suffix protein